MKTVGIIGGMGTLATLDFFKKIVSNTEAKCDSEHLHILIENDSDIPDRTAFIQGNGVDPAPYLIHAAKNLESIGADYIVMPCNTAHYFYDKIASEIKVPIIHMIEETAKEASLKNITKLGLLATLGTYETNLYTNILSRYNIEVIYPSENEQIIINELIYKVKAEEFYDAKNVYSIIENLGKSGAGGIILGCTELPVAIELLGIDGEFLDPTLILAKAVVLHSGQKLKRS